MPASDCVAGIRLSCLVQGFGDVAGNDVTVTGIAMDSRRVRPGDLFLAVPGLRHDGRDHAAAAMAAGCVAVVSEAEALERFPALCSAPVPVVAVQGLTQHLSTLAGRFYGDPSGQMAVIGVTGTNGKTTCTWLLAQLFALAGKPAGVVGTLGYGRVGATGETFADTGMTTPDPVLTQQVLATLRDDNVEMVAMEVSSHSLDQHRVDGVHFETAVFTNLSRDHLDYHGDVDSYGAAKARLFTLPGLRRAVINLDDDFGRQLYRQLPPGMQAITCGLHQPADLTASAVHYSTGGIAARVHTPWGDGDLQTALLGEFNLANLLAVIAAACSTGLSLEAVLRSLPDLRPVPGRMEVVTVESVDQPLVVVDYAHTPDALDNALRALRQHCTGQLWCVFGCGGDRDAGKRPLMGAIAAQQADRVVITSDNPRSENPDAIIDQILAGSGDGDQVMVEPDRGAAIRLAVARASVGDTVLIAGKGHEDFQQVGIQRLPFSDVAEARLALRETRGGAR